MGRGASGPRPPLLPSRSRRERTLVDVLRDRADELYVLAGARIDIGGLSLSHEDAARDADVTPFLVISGSVARLDHLAVACDGPAALLRCLMDIADDPLTVLVAAFDLRDPQRPMPLAADARLRVEPRRARGPLVRERARRRRCREVFARYVKASLHPTFPYGPAERFMLVLEASPGEERGWYVETARDTEAFAPAPLGRPEALRAVFDLADARGPQPVLARVEVSVRIDGRTRMRSWPLRAS